MQGFGEFVKEVKFLVGDGSRVKFWEDLWCSNSPLMVEFPSLYSITTNKESLVMDCLGGDSGNRHWNVLFVRHFNDWELEEVMAFYQVLYESKILEGENDSLVWRKDSKGLFSVKSFYNCLSPIGNSFLPAKVTWVSSVPTKVAFFCWLVGSNKCLTLDRLAHRGWNVPNRCVLCKQDAEIVDHLFIHCFVARSLWMLLFNMFGIHWVLPLSTFDLLVDWWFKGGSKKAKVIWYMAPHSILWCIWKERNARTFDGVEKSTIELKSSFVKPLFMWFSSYSNTRNLSFVEFIESFKL